MIIYFRKEELHEILDAKQTHVDMLLSCTAKWVAPGTELPVAV